MRLAARALYRRPPLSSNVRAHLKRETRVIAAGTVVAALVVVTPALLAVLAWQSRAATETYPAVTAALLLVLLQSTACAAIIVAARRLQPRGVVSRVAVAAGTALASIVLIGLAFVPLALLLKAIRFALPWASQALYLTEQYLYSLARHPHTAAALLLLVPMLAVVLAVTWPSRASASLGAQQ